MLEISSHSLFMYAMRWASFLGSYTTLFDHLRKTVLTTIRWTECVKKKMSMFARLVPIRSFQKVQGKDILVQNEDRYSAGLMSDY